MTLEKAICLFAIWFSALWAIGIAIITWNSFQVIYLPLLGELVRFDGVTAVYHVQWWTVTAAAMAAAIASVWWAVARVKNTIK